jgi:DNA-binding NarL/FixJ family response regulator
MIPLCIVDDDPLVLSALKTLISTSGQFTCVGTLQSGEELIEQFSQLNPEVILMDIRMGNLNGIQTAKNILHEYPKTRILFLTTFSDDEYIIQALKIGASGYLLKQNYDSIVPALIAVNQGQRVFGEAIGDRLPQFLETQPVPVKKSYSEFGLNDREFQILESIAQGLSNKEISQTIYLGEGTVRNYISTMLDKLNLRDRTQLAVFYYQTFA